MSRREEVFKRCEDEVKSYLARIKWGKNRDADIENTRILSGTTLGVRIVGLMESNLGDISKDMEEYFNSRHGPKFFEGFYDVSYLHNSSSIKEVRVNMLYLDRKEQEKPVGGGDRVNVYIMRIFVFALFILFLLFQIGKWITVGRSVTAGLGEETTTTV